LSERARRGRWTEMPPMIGDENDRHLAVTGTSEELGDRLRSLYEVLVDRIALYQPNGAPEDEAGWRRLVDGLGAAGS
jgi:hypothetical protein